MLIISLSFIERIALRLVFCILKRIVFSNKKNQSFPINLSCMDKYEN